MKSDVLLVDDNVLERYFERGLLEKLGMRLDEASDGDEAVDLVRANDYSVVIVDERMPKKDGWDTISSILAIKPDLPFIMMSDREQNGSDGISILKKPLEYRRLTEAINRLLNEVDTYDDAAVETGPSLDKAVGIKNCGSAEGYVEALGVYYSTMLDKADEIESYHKSGDITNYTIKVHALKSSSRIIGALRLADLAEELEMCGKSGDTDTIDRKTPGLLEFYRSYYEVIGAMVDKPAGEEQGKARVPADMLADAYASFVDFVDQMDVDLMEMVIDSLEAYKLPDEDAKIIGEIRHRLASLDWDGISRIINDHNK